MHPAIRRYEKNDETAVLQLAEICSWDSTPTEADIQGFHSSEPDFFLVAELNQKIIGFVYGRESKNVPNEVLRKWKATRVGSVEVLAVEEKYRWRGIGTQLLKSSFKPSPRGESTRSHCQHQLRRLRQKDCMTNWDSRLEAIS